MATPAVFVDSTTTALDLFRTRQASGHTTVLTFYRAERSFFCKQWLKRWLSIPSLDRRLAYTDVIFIFISSQSQGKAYSVADQIAGRKSLLDTHVFFFGDPEHLLVNYLADMGISAPVITNPDTHRAHGWVFDYGMVQPAVICVGNGDVLYEWTSKPSLLNVAGKRDRPDPWDVWDRIEHRLDRIRITKARAARKALSNSTAQVEEQKGDTVVAEKQAPVLDATASSMDRVEPRDKSAPNVQLSMQSLGSSQIIGSPESPVLTEESEKNSVLPPPHATTNEGEKMLIDENENEKEIQSNIHPEPFKESEHCEVSDDFDAAAAEKNAVPNVDPVSEPVSDARTGPLSTAIDTLTSEAMDNSVAKEEPDMSEEEVAKVPMENLSEKINELTSGVLADESLPCGTTETTHEPETVAVIPSLAFANVKASDQSETGATAVADGEENEDDMGVDVNVQESRGLLAESDSPASLEEGGSDAKDGENEMVVISAADDIVGDTELTDNNLISDTKDGYDEDEIKDGNLDEELDDLADTKLEVEPEDDVEDEENGIRGHFPASAEKVVEGEMTAEAEVVEESQPEYEMDAGVTGAIEADEEASDTGNMDASDELKPSKPDSTAMIIEGDDIGGVRCGDDDLGKSANSEDLDAVDADDVVDDSPTKWMSSVGTTADSVEPPASKDLFDMHSPSNVDVLETSVASVGSDQVDSTAVIVKHTSVRTEDSAQINLLTYDGNSFPSEKHIPEEADDKKTGISDYLKELKDPSKLHDPRYIRRYDPLQPLKPGSRRPILGMTAVTRAADFRTLQDTNVNADVALTHGLIQQETNVSFMDDRQSGGFGQARSGAHLPPLKEHPIMDRTIGAETKNIPGADSPVPGTASPHPESRNMQRTNVIDVSPFADADLDLGAGETEEGGIKSSLRDEYEAFDEYIVCEYEVEEYMEEYESDTLPGSKVFVTTVVDDSSHGESMATSGSRANDGREMTQFDRSKVVDVRGAAPQNTSGDGKGTVWKEGGPSQPNNMPTPALMSNLGEARPPTYGPVRKVLRKMRVPMSARRHDREDRDDMESARVSRKDTLRAVLRKPRDREVDELGEGDGDDEHTARLGRKETIKSVLRKIPVPKNLKRSQTDGVIRDAEDDSRDATARTSRRGGLQAVLQRLPSLSASTRGQREGPIIATEEVGSEGEDTARDTAMEVEEGETNVAAGKVDTTVRVEGIGAQNGGGEEAGHERDAWSDSSSELDVRGGGVAEALKRGKFRRTFSRLAGTGGRIIEADRTDGAQGNGNSTALVDTNIAADHVAVARDETTAPTPAEVVGVSVARPDDRDEGVGGVGSGGLGRKRRRREEEGERVGAKVSFAMVGGRILSRFKLGG